MRPDATEIAADLRARCPETAHAEWVEVLAELANALRDIEVKFEGRMPPPDLGIKYCRGAISLLEGLHGLGPVRVADSLAEQIAAKALLNADALMASIPVAGRA